MTQEAVGGEGVVGQGEQNGFLRCIVIETSKVLQSRLIAELILILRLHHSWSLRSQHFDRLEDVHHALITHPLQHDTQRDEDSGAPDTSAAVDRYRPVLSELLLGFMHLPDKVYETLSGFGHPLFRPVGELELPHSPGLSVPSICDFKLSEDVLRHVVLGHRVHHEVLISSRTLGGPILMTLFPAHLSQFGQHHHDGGVILP